MEELIARNQSRQSIKAVIDYIEDDQFNARNYVQLSNQLSHLIKQWGAFAENSNLLRIHANDDDEEKEHADIYMSIEQLYLESKSILEFRINELNAAEQQQQQQFIPQEYVPVPQPQPIVVRVEQPKRDIENTWGEFNGNLTKWRAFCDLFTDRVHNDDALAPAHKFRLLKSSLKGTAAAALGDWELSDGNYAEAWNRLKELYEQTYLTGSKLVQRLIALPKLDKATGQGIQKMSNIGNEVFRQLRALKYPTENVDFMFIFILHERLDDETCIKWNLERTTEYPKLSEFLAFLDRQARALTTIQESKKTFVASTERKRISVAEQAKFVAKRSKVEATEAKQPEQAKCANCKGSHTIYKCYKFKEMTLSARKELVKANRLCLNCLKPGHVVKDCPGKECYRCNKKHNSLLCSENPANKPNTPVQQKANVVTRSARKKSLSSMVSTASESTETN